MHRVQLALDPVVGGAVAVLLERRGVPGFHAIELGAFEQHLPDAVDLRAVGVFGGFAAGVVLAMDRHPFPGHHPGGEPQPETEKVAGEGCRSSARCA